MAAVDTLFPRILLYVPGAPEPLLRDELVLAANEFCRETWVCQETLPLVSDADGLFVLAAPSGFECIAVMRLVANGTLLWQQWPNLADPMAAPVAQPARFEVSTAPLTVRMTPAASTPQSIAATVVVTPVVGANDVPASLLSTWAEAVTAKALQRMMVMPNQMFTNPSLAQHFAAKYAAERTKARIEFNRGFARYGTLMAMPKFTRR